MAARISPWSSAFRSATPDLQLRTLLYMPASFLKIGGELVANSILVRAEVTQELNEHDWCVVEMRQTEDARPLLEESLGKDLQIATHDEDGAQRVVFPGFILETELEYELAGSFTARLT